MAQKKNSQRRPARNRRHIVAMGVLWLVLAGGLGIFGWRAWAKRADRARSLAGHMRQGLVLLRQGDFAALAGAASQLTRALAVDQRRMRLWSGLCLTEARRKVLYGVGGEMWQRYRSGATALLSDAGEEVLDPLSEAMLMEADLLMAMGQTRGTRDIMDLYFRARRDWGYHPRDPGLTAVRALALAGIGRLTEAIATLDGVGGYGRLVRGLLLLEADRDREAAGVFGAILKENPRCELALLGLATADPRQREALAARLGGLQNHQSLNIRIWATWLSLAPAAPGEISRKVAGLPPPTLPALLKRFVSLHLAVGNREAVLDLYNRLAAVRIGDAPFVRLVDARILFMDGDPDGAWERLRTIPRPHRGHYGVMFLWFAQRFAEARSEARGLPKSAPWRRLAEGHGVDTDDPVLELARHWRECSDHRHGHYSLVSGLSRDHEARFYIKYLGARLALEEAHRSGHGTKPAEKLYRRALAFIGEKEGESFVGRRLKALAWHCLGEDGKALALLQSICDSGGAAGHGACESERAIDSDRQLLLELLLYPDGPEKDLVIALSKSLALLPKVARTPELNLRWKARLALLQVTLLPGMVQQVVKGVMDLVDPKITYERETLIALAPVYALAGQVDKSMELWRLNYGNEVDHSLQLAAFLELIAHHAQSLTVADALLARGDITDHSRRQALAIKAKALRGLKRDPVETLTTLAREFPSDESRRALAEGLLYWAARGKAEEICPMVVPLLMAEKKAGALLGILQGFGPCVKVPGMGGLLVPLTRAWKGKTRERILKLTTTRGATPGDRVKRP